MPRKPKGHPVSPDNPCPFLRALVSQGLLPDDVASIGQVTDTVMKVAATAEGGARLPAAAIRAVALAANGLGPGNLARNLLSGLRLNELRNGPLDKKGVGSGILDSQGDVVKAELARLEGFASDKTDIDGNTEPGLSARELKAMMDANFERAKGRRRVVDRAMMDGEWPVLLKVIGKKGKKGRYLSVADVRRLFMERRLPERMLQQLPAA